MKSELKFKTRASIPYILSIILVFFFITQINNFIDRDFFNRTSWLIYGVILIYVYIFNLFFIWSFELHSTYLKVRYSLFLRSSKIYDIKDILYVKVFKGRGKGIIPSLKIGMKDKNVTHYFFLISNRSINELVIALKDLSIEVSVTEFNNGD
jgi:hypothetical protein